MKTIADIKVGTKIAVSNMKDGVEYSTENWTVSNVTAKNVMYRDGNSHIFQTNKIEISRYSHKQFLTFINKGWSKGNHNSTFTIQ